MDFVEDGDMPAPDAKVMYRGGMFGPAMFHYAPAERNRDYYDDIARECGFEIRTLTLAADVGYDDEHPLMKAYDAGECSWVFAEWLPAEQKDGWKLVGMHDTDDGPAALFLRPIPAAASL